MLFLTAEAGEFMAEIATVHGDSMTVRFKRDAAGIARPDPCGGARPEATMARPDAARINPDR